MIFEEVKSQAHSQQYSLQDYSYINKQANVLPVLGGDC